MIWYSTSFVAQSWKMFNCLLGQPGIVSTWNKWEIMPIIKIFGQSKAIVLFYVSASCVSRMCRPLVWYTLSYIKPACIYVLSLIPLWCIELEILSSFNLPPCKWQRFSHWTTDKSCNLDYCLPSFLPCCVSKRKVAFIKCKMHHSYICLAFWAAFSLFKLDYFPEKIMAV